MNEQLLVRGVIPWSVTTWEVLWRFHPIRRTSRSGRPTFSRTRLRVAVLVQLVVGIPLLHRNSHFGAANPGNTELQSRHTHRNTFWNAKIDLVAVDRSRKTACPQDLCWNSIDSYIDRRICNCEWAGGKRLSWRN